MTLKSTEVTLVNGEKVQLALDSVCNQKQIFVRIGSNLIAGIVEHAIWQGIYIWQEVNGLYRLLGDVVFKNQEDGLVIWDLHVGIQNSIEFERRAARLAEQHPPDSTTGSRVVILSIAPGVTVPVLPDNS